MSDGNGKPAWASITFGNVLALVAIIGGTIAVYTQIRSNQAVGDNQIAVLSRQIEMDRSAQQQFSEQMRAQLSQIAKDVSYLQGLIATQGQKK